MNDHFNNKNITLCIFKSNARNMQYGVGTYIRVLIESLIELSYINILIISIKNHKCIEPSLKSLSNRVSEIQIPYPFLETEQNDSFENKYASVMLKLLYNLMPTPPNRNIIFQVNSSEELPIALKLKKYFSYPIISVVHSASWQMMFEGNFKKFHDLNIDKPSNCLETTVSRERELYRISDHIVSVTNYMKDFLINIYSIDVNRITTIHNGLNFDKYLDIPYKEKNILRKKLGFQKSDIIILFSGRIDSCKGIFFLMESFEKACKFNSKLRLILLGQGSIGNCQRLLKSYYGHVTYTGYLPEETVLSFYRIADIGVIPSLYDHCPYSALEMTANRIPLIISKTKGLDEIFTGNDCIFINPLLSYEGDISFSVNELSEAILALATNQELRIKIARNSFIRLRNKFSSISMAGKMDRLIHSVVE